MMSISFNSTFMGFLCQVQWREKRGGLGIEAPRKYAAHFDNSLHVSGIIVSQSKPLGPGA